MTKQRKSAPRSGAKRQPRIVEAPPPSPVEQAAAPEGPAASALGVETRVAPPVPDESAPPTAIDRSEEDDTPPRRMLRDAIAAREGQSNTLAFTIGREWFAIDLAAVEEAIELPAVHHLPEMPEHMLGVFELRGRLVPVYSPVRVLRVPLARQAAAVLVLRWRDKRMGLAVDDVDDVLVVEASSVRRAPIADNEDNVLLGVIRRGSDLVALVDADALAQACLAHHLTEAA